MPRPNNTLRDNVNPLSTNTLPALNANGVANTTPMNTPFFRRTDKPYVTITASTASTTYTVSNPSGDLEPCVIFIQVEGTAEYGLFVHHGGSTAVTRIGGSTNVVAGASPGATQVALNNNSGVLEIKTGSGTIVGTPTGSLRIVRID